MSKVPGFETLILTRAGRRLTITMNRPEVLNHALMDPGLAYEALSVRREEHRRRVAAFVQRSRNE